MENVMKKRTSGRRKIPIEKIANKCNLQVTFSKRRVGLFKKASELRALCGAEVAVIVESPAGKVYSFGNPSVDSVLYRFETGVFGPQEDEYLEAHKDKEMGKSNWWEDMSLENLGLQQLEECMAAMEILKKNLLKRADDMGTANTSDDVLIPNLTLDQLGRLPLQYYDLGGHSN